MTQALIDIAARHSVHLEGVKGGYVRDFEKFLRSLQKDVLAQLVGVEDGSLKGRRLNRLLKVIRETLNEGYGDYYAAWLRNLEDLGEYEAEFTVKSLGQVVRADFNLPTAQEVLTAAFAQPLHVEGTDGGKLLQTFWKDWTQKASDRIVNAIRLGAAQGQTTAEIVRRIRGTRARNYKDGLWDVNRRDATLMTRTALHHIATQARTETYRANRNVVKAEQFVAVLDGRTSVQCRALSEREFPVGEGPMPPLHIACRSTRVAVLKGGLNLLRKGGSQIARDSDGNIVRVPSDLSYFEWLKTQPQAFQDDVIGPERGKLLRDGGLSATRFAELQLDKNFAPMTLAEMRAKEPLAFELAGL